MTTPADISSLGFEDFEVQEGKATLIENILAQGVTPFLSTSSNTRKKGAYTSPPVSFRMDEYLTRMIEKIVKIWEPRFSERSDVLRTLIGMAAEAILDNQDADSIADVQSSIDAERMMNSILVEEQAKLEIRARLYALGNFVSEYMQEDELDIAVQMLRNWISVVEKQKDENRLKRYRRAFVAQPEIQNVVRRAEAAGTPGVEEVAEYITANQGETHARYR